MQVISSHLSLWLKEKCAGISHSFQPNAPHPEQALSLAQVEDHLGKEPACLDRPRYRIEVKKLLGIFGPNLTLANLDTFFFLTFPT